MTKHDSAAHYIPFALWRAQAMGMEGIQTSDASNLTVRVIALSTLKTFINRNPAYADARDPLLAWYRHVRKADWANPADLKRDFGSASILRGGRAVFNIGGNRYRVVVWINYPRGVVYIRFVGTHQQ